MILSGEKKEEYRDIKEYWADRLTSPSYSLITFKAIKDLALPNDFFKQFTHVEFTNGYGGNRPRILIECKGVKKGYGHPEWGAIEETEYFVIRLGDIIETYNIDETINTRTPAADIRSGLQKGTL